jgi:Protein of unknown function (DUF2911)
MNRFASALVAVAVVLAAGLPALAQQKRLSPHETVSSVVSGDRVMIVYGRPYTKSPRTGEIRKIWGGLVPFGKVWRTGADEATLLITQQPIVLGGAAIPAGCYSVWTLPNDDGTAKLIINKQIGQWGESMGNPKDVYDEANDVARVDLKKSGLDDSVDQFTITIEKDPDVKGGGLIKLKWEKTQYAVAFTVAS